MLLMDNSHLASLVQGKADMPKPQPASGPTLKAPGNRINTVTQRLGGPSFERESSMTFCNPDQSRERREKRKLVQSYHSSKELQGLSHNYQSAMKDFQDRAASAPEARNKRQRVASLMIQTKPKDGELRERKVAQQGPIDDGDLTLAAEESTVQPARNAQSEDGAVGSGNSEDEAESTIVVAGANKDDGPFAPAEEPSSAASTTKSSYVSLVNQVTGSEEAKSVSPAQKKKASIGGKGKQHNKQAGKATHANLLSQFSARTGDMQASNNPGDTGQVQVARNQEGGRHLRDNPRPSKKAPGAVHWRDVKLK